MNYTAAERETSIVWDDETKIAHIYTSQYPTINKLDKLCAAYPDTHKRVWTESDGERVTAAKYEVYKGFIRFAKPRSEAQKESARRAAEMMLAAKNIVGK